MWESTDTIGRILDVYSLGWWVILCACMAIYGIFRFRGVKCPLVGKNSFLIVFFSVCIVYTALSVLFMYLTGREELVFAEGIFRWAGQHVILFLIVYYPVRWIQKTKAHKIVIALIFAAVLYVAADGLRVMIVSEKIYGCAAQAEEKRRAEQRAKEEKRLAEQRAKERVPVTANDLSVVATTTMYYPYFWERFFKASKCPE